MKGLDVRILGMKLRKIVGTVTKDFAGLYLDLIEVKIIRKMSK
ncbi:hypothetical protein P4H27_04315 [Paenibacillus taichungensis]|nr:hypothetical protein [Paenibacillus taichungensis]MEC0106155.1 hypothetical protein [Paenibacillus taichungensis]MEC0196844.1 hypothetical protein [Paenibacillus taichungensis]